MRKAILSHRILTISLYLNITASSCAEIDESVKKSPSVQERIPPALGLKKTIKIRVWSKEDTPYPDGLAWSTTTYCGLGRDADRQSGLIRGGSLEVEWPKSCTNDSIEIRVVVGGDWRNCHPGHFWRPDLLEGQPVDIWLGCKK